MQERDNVERSTGGVTSAATTVRKRVLHKLLPFSGRCTAFGYQSVGVVK